MDTVVLSPHLDDAVLSLGALIGREVAAGRKVEVWTFYTAGPPIEAIPEERRVFGDYAARRAEDERALAVLGAGHRWLDLHERLFREPTLAKTTHVFHTPPREGDFSELARVRAIVGELIAGGAQVYAPLAIGHHVDHTEVTLGVLHELIARKAWDRVRFYEDPYSLGGACRKAHFVARQQKWKLFGAPGWASPRVAALLRVIAAMADGPNVDDYLPEAARLTWTCSPAPVTPDEEAKKLAAVVEYVSQMKAFGGAGAVRAFMQRGHATLGGEPLWTCRP